MREEGNVESRKGKEGKGESRKGIRLGERGTEGKGWKVWVSDKV